MIHHEMHAQPLPTHLRTKEDVRHWVWNTLTVRNIAIFPLPCTGRIPNFKGSDVAAKHLTRMPAFRNAEAIFCGPDYVLKSCRDLVLQHRKILAFATPHMTAFKQMLPSSRPISTTIRALRRLGQPLTHPVNLILIGSVAADLRGNRIGKGSGYGDQEIAFLRSHRLLTPHYRIATLVHPLQIVQNLAPLMSSQDIACHYLLTPEGIISTSSNKE
jgi:5-formyltetrahydrofolate cyclo-ligase